MIYSAVGSVIDFIFKVAGSIQFETDRYDEALIVPGFRLLAFVILGLHQA